VLAALLIAALQPAAAETWPARPIRFIATGPAGGAGDVIARIVMERVARGLGVAVVVENRPGAGTNIGAAAVARAAPDGYTIGLASLASNAVNVSLYQSLPFDPAKDFEAVGLMALVPNLMIVPNRLAARNVQEFVALCRAAPQGFRYGSIGAGSSQHLAGLRFAIDTGCQLDHISYTNVGALNGDVINGRLEVAFPSISSAIELARAGQLRALAVSSPERLAAMPSAPTLLEVGIQLTSGGWFGVMAPAGTPAPILDRLAQEVSAALAEPDLAARIVATGGTPRDISRAAFAAFMAEETATWREVVRRSGATVD
jgi:tripartite-type tricarboxylate transporter receptor subunit TctC